MNTVEGHALGIVRLLLAVVLLGASCAWAQEQASTPAQQEQDQKQADKSVAPTQDQPVQTQTSPVDEKDEVKITPRQAEELFHSVDEILDFDSKQTGLPIKREVKRKLTSRDEVVSYLTKHLER